MRETTNLLKVTTASPQASSQTRSRRQSSKGPPGAERSSSNTKHRRGLEPPQPQYRIFRTGDNPPPSPYSRTLFRFSHIQFISRVAIGRVRRKEANEGMFIAHMQRPGASRAHDDLRVPRVCHGRRLPGDCEGVIGHAPASASLPFSLSRLLHSCLLDTGSAESDTGKGAGGASRRRLHKASCFLLQSTHRRERVEGEGVLYRGARRSSSVTGALPDGCTAAVRMRSSRREKAMGAPCAS